MLKSFLAVLVLLVCSLPVFAQTTYYVLQGGGSRYSSAVPTGQCNGLKNVTYAAALLAAGGKMTNLDCAWGDYRYSFDDQSYNSYTGTGWGIKGGDKLVVGAGQWRVGWDAATGPGAGYTWCAGGQGACQNPVIPAGTAAQHTQIIAACYPNCNESNMTQLYGGFGIGTPLDLGSAQFVDVIGFEITRHSNCIWFGSPAFPSGCAGQTPVADFDSDGIHTNNQTHDVYLQDMWIHGHTGRGIKGPIGGLVTCERCDISYNGGAGWDFDDGKETPLINPIWQFLDSNISYSGCNQDYPNQNQAVSCYGQSNGGYGDGVGTPPGSCLSALINHSTFHHNTQDALDLGHVDTGACTLVITNSKAWSNGGGGFKWGPAYGTVFVNNNMDIGDCLRMHYPDASQPDTYNANLGDFCRAQDAMPFDFYDYTNAVVTNNTIVSYAPTTIDLQCWGSANDPNGNCPNATLNFSNNVILGYDNPVTYSNGGQAPGPGGMFISAGNVPNITRNGNTWFGVRGITCLPTERCTNPQFVGQPTGNGTTFAPTELDNFNAALALNSPSVGTGFDPSITAVPTNAPVVVAPTDAATMPPPVVTPPPIVAPPPPAPFPVAQMTNAVKICDEGCTITSISVNNAVLQFGTGTTWGPTFTTNVLPLLVSYVSPNLVLSPQDPAPNVVKEIDAQRQNADYTVTWTLNGVETTTIVHGLVVAVPASITWAAPSAVVYGTVLSTLQLNATASVTGTFVYSPASGTLPTAGTQTLSVTFTPTDTINFTKATASVKLVVSQAVPVVTWATPASIKSGTSLSSTQLNAKASVPGKFVYTPASGTVLSQGTYTLSVKFTPTDAVDYAPVTKTVQLVVTPKWPCSGTVSYSISATGILTYGTPSVCK